MIVYALRHKDGWLDYSGQLGKLTALYATLDVAVHAAYEGVTVVPVEVMLPVYPTWQPIDDADLYRENYVSGIAKQIAAGTLRATPEATWEILK